MNDLLSDTMRNRAEGVGRPLVDLDAVMKSGERRRKRRGALVVAGAAAVCAIVGVGAVQVAGTSDGAEAPGYAGKSSFVERKPTYATGSTIHYGNQQIDVDTKIHAFIQTDDGFVLGDPRGAVLFADGESVQEIGDSRKESPLVADESGSYAAWVDNTNDGPPEFVVYDTSTLTEVVRTSEGNRPGKDAVVGGHPRVIAVDGDRVYVRNARGLARIDIPSGHSELLRPGVDEDAEIVDVEDGLRLRRIFTGNPDLGESEPPGVIVRGQSGESLVVAGGRDLSPGAHYVTSDATDSEQIYDTRTGDEVVLDTEEYGFQFVTRWIDADTAVVGVLKDPDAANPEISMLTCELPSGECEVAADDLPSNIKLPTGDSR
ncbi:MAG: hypothetical protein L0K86_03780 [Actinomycetia bacterium]|nr:hypothetical protein [Actinomycetes bacterium]